MVGQRLRLRAYLRMLALCLDVGDEDLRHFQGIADDAILDILPVDG